MIKYILSLVLLTGCATATVAAPTPAEIPHEVPRLSQVMVNGVLVSCNQQEVNSALVWHECHFENHSVAIHDVCVRLQYNDKRLNALALSRPICSGPLLTGEMKVRYLAFYKENRRHLDVCGSDLTQCITSFQVTRF